MPFHRSCFTQHLQFLLSFSLFVFIFNSILLILLAVNFYLFFECPLSLRWIIEEHCYFRCFVYHVSHFSYVAGFYNTQVQLMRWAPRVNCLKILVWHVLPAHFLHLTCSLLHHSIILSDLSYQDRTCLVKHFWFFSANAKPAIPVSHSANSTKSSQISSSSLT